MQQQQQPQQLSPAMGRARAHTQHEVSGRRAQARRASACMHTCQRWLALKLQAHNNLPGAQGRAHVPWLRRNHVALALIQMQRSVASGNVQREPLASSLDGGLVRPPHERSADAFAFAHTTHTSELHRSWSAASRAHHTYHEPRQTQRCVRCSTPRMRRWGKQGVSCSRARAASAADVRGKRTCGPPTAQA